MMMMMMMMMKKEEGLYIAATAAAMTVDQVSTVHNFFCFSVLPLQAQIRAAM